MENENGQSYNSFGQHLRDKNSWVRKEKDIEGREIPKNDSNEDIQGEWKLDNNNHMPDLVPVFFEKLDISQIAK